MGPPMITLPGRAAAGSLQRLWPAQGELFLPQLDGVVAQLQADVPDCKLDRKALATLLAQLMQFMEDALGRQASSGPWAALR